MRLRTLVPITAIALLALAGCSNDTAGSDSNEPSSGTTTSASVSPSATPSSSTSEPTSAPSSEKSEAPAEEPGLEETSEAPVPQEPEPAETPAQAAPERADATAPTVGDYFATGGQCIHDVWTSTLEYTDDLYNEVADYCNANDLGDWANGWDPQEYYENLSENMDPSSEPEDEQNPEFTEEQRQQCEVLDPDTASSGEIQWCAYNGYPTKYMLDYEG